MRLWTLFCTQEKCSAIIIERQRQHSKSNVTMFSLLDKSFTLYIPVMFLRGFLFSFSLFLSSYEYTVKWKSDVSFFCIVEHFLMEVFIIFKYGISNLARDSCCTCFIHNFHTHTCFWNYIVICRCRILLRNHKKEEITAELFLCLVYSDKSQNSQNNVNRWKRDAIPT